MCFDVYQDCETGAHAHVWPRTPHLVNDFVFRNFVFEIYQGTPVDVYKL